jgi:hypothetical protein
MRLAVKFAAILAFAIGLATIAGAPAQAQGVHFHSVLVGGNEVGGGDTNGYGTAALHFRSSTELCVAIIVNRIAPPTAMHIHKEFAPKNGPIVINLTAPVNGDPGGSFGCVTVASNFYSDIRANPSRFYLNVHTGDFPAGSIRGQLFQ